MADPQPQQLPPRVKITCPACGRFTRTRQPEGSQLPCVPCNVDHGRTTMLTVPAGPGNRPIIRPPEPPPRPAGMARITRRRTGPAQVQCSGCHATVDLPSPPSKTSPSAG